MGVESGATDIRDLITNIVSSNDVEQWSRFLAGYRFMFDVSSFLDTVTSLDGTAQFRESVARFSECWLRFYFDDDFRGVTRALHVITYVDTICPGSITVNKLKLLLLRRRTPGKSEKKQILIDVKLPEPAAQVLPSSDGFSSFHDEVKSTTLAEHLCMIDAELFANVHPREFNNGNWLKPHKETFAPNLTRLAQLFNHMAGLISTEVVSQKDAKQRGAAIRYFVEVAKKLRELKNYNSLMMILAGLNHSAVSRLKESWKCAGRLTRKSLEELDELMCHIGNYKNYREEFNSIAGTAAIPFLSVVLRDITFSNEGNPDKLENGSINVEKLTMLGEQLLSVLSFRNVKFSFNVEVPILSTICCKAPLNEEQLMRSSFEVEPPANPMAILLLDEEFGSSNRTSNDEVMSETGSDGDTRSDHGSVSEDEELADFSLINIPQSERRQVTLAMKEKPFASWSADEVFLYLNLSRFPGSYVNNLRKMEVDGRQLSAITADRLLTLGITQLGHRKRLLRTVRELVDYQQVLHSGSALQLQVGDAVASLMAPKHKSCKIWDTEDLHQWLTDIELEMYIESFDDNEITGEMLLTLSKDEVSELGINLLGHRKRIMKALTELREREAGLERGASPSPGPRTSRFGRSNSVVCATAGGVSALSSQMHQARRRRSAAGVTRTISASEEGSSLASRGLSSDSDSALERQCSDGTMSDMVSHDIRPTASEGTEPCSMVIMCKYQGSNKIYLRDRRLNFSQLRQMLRDEYPSARNFRCARSQTSIVSQRTWESVVEKARGGKVKLMLE